MMFYLDTSIWIDFIEDRTGYAGEPIGSYAIRLIFYIVSHNHKLMVSDILLEELEVRYPVEEISGLFMPFMKNIQKIYSTKEQLRESHTIAQERSIPSGDVLHAILARDYEAVLITRDNHFRLLSDLSDFSTPESFLSSL